MDGGDPINSTARKESQEGEFTEVLLVEAPKAAAFVESVAKEGKDVVNAAVYTYFRAAAREGLVSSSSTD